jgi:hypothetical protein
MYIRARLTSPGSAHSPSSLSEEENSSPIQIRCRPRVSPSTKGRNGPTQEHALKEEVAPADVIVFRNGNVEQGFHPGRKPHLGGTETGSGK